MRRAKTTVWPAPVKGLVRAGTNVQASPDAAEVLDNFIPTAQGARLRGGSVLFATTDDPVLQLMNYRSGGAEALFAATATDIFDVSAVADPEIAPVADITGLTSGDWSYTQFATAGGEFLFMVNGADPAQHYNGTAWAAPVITGVSSSDLSFVWAHKKRLWFVEKDLPYAWYLPVNSIAGAATTFPLAGVFRLGGALLFGGTWSLDSGDGLDDVAIFVSTEGEIAVYQGTDPDTAADWSLTGVYRIGKPLDKNAWIRAGGDLLIVTEDGIVSVQEALQRDRAALQVSAITAPIEELWQESIANRTISGSRFPVVVWPTQTILIIAVPDTSGIPLAYVANTRTGAWARVTGWDIQCLSVYGDRLYFGTSDGQVVLADATGSDLGEPYTALYVPKFQEFNTPDDKIALHARATWRADVDADVRLTCFANYAVGTFPAVAPLSLENANKWGGGGKWGSGLKWGAGKTRIAGSDWQAVAGMGFSLAPGLTVASNRVTQPQFELASMHLRYEEGRSI